MEVSRSGIQSPKPTETEERFMSCGFKVSPVRWIQMEGEVERNWEKQREGKL